MPSKFKRVGYFIFLMLMIGVFIGLYIYDQPKISEKDDAFMTLFKFLDPEHNYYETVEKENDQDHKNNQVEKPERALNKTETSQRDTLSLLNLEAKDISFIRVKSSRTNYTLIRKGYRRWIAEKNGSEIKVPRSNNKIFRITNIIKYLVVNTDYSRDYSDYAPYFEKPMCEVTVSSAKGKFYKMTFIRIPTEIKNRFIMAKFEYYVRLNDESIIYKVTYNSLERFLVDYDEFAKIY